MKDARASGLADWARRADLNLDIPATAALLPASDDASFRRYFRFDAGAAGVVFVDAPPDREDNESFAQISAVLDGAGLTCPRVLAADFELGFLAVTDLGDCLYLDELQRDAARQAALYDEAVSAILRMLTIDCDLPPYDESRLLTEMALFHEWFLPGRLGMTVSAEVRAMLDEVYDFLAQSALAQPTGFVHRDYHCRNLLVVAANGPGILDFQDAVIGPVSYDLVSLYKDCYYRFGRAHIVAQAGKFKQQLQDAGIIDGDAPFLRWFDLMGAQRHLKCAGIFSRLHLRDGKPGYLADLPLVLDYLLEVASLYRELAGFRHFLASEVLPRMDRPE